MELKSKFDTLNFHFTRACMAATCKLMGGDPAAPGISTILGSAFRQLFSQLEPQQQPIPIPVRTQQPFIPADDGPYSRYG